MINQSRLIHDMVEFMPSIPGLQQLSEHELVDLQHSILSLQIDLRRISRFDDEFVEEVASTQGFLNKWQTLIERIFAAKQTSTTSAELCNWDNEGGALSKAFPEK